MGRNYFGDIDGKFGFACQSSDDADFFGVTGYQPNHGTTSSQLGIDDNTFNDFLKLNARLHLGLQIKESIETKGQCYFEAEL